MKLAINTETQAQFDALIKLIPVVLESRHWQDYKEETCVSIKGFSGLGWYKYKGYTIIPFTDFAELAGIKWEEPKEFTKEEQIKDLLNKVIELIETK